LIKMVAKIAKLVIFAFFLTNFVEARKIEGDVVDVAIAAGNFKTLVQLLTDLELVDALREAQAQTIFAPSDEAFAKLPEGTLESLTTEQALAIVLRHVVGGVTVPAADVVTGPVETLGGEVIDLIKTDEGGVLISYMGNEIKVVTADVMASNGVIHVIEEVILPKAEEPEECEGCREGAGIIFSHLNGGSLDSIIQLFDREICQKEEHPGACIEGVNTWWPVIAKIIYNDAAARKVCTALSQGACEAKKAWDCDACVGFVGAVAHVYGSDEGVNAITLALEGEAFCKSEEMALDEETTRKCIREIKHFMPLALHVVGHAMHEYSHHICRDWFHGICHHG